MSKHLTPETRAGWRKAAEQATYYGGVEQEQADRVLALLDALDEAERDERERIAWAMSGVGAHRDPCRLPDTSCLCGVCEFREEAARIAREGGQYLSAALAGTDPTDTEGDDRD